MRHKISPRFLISAYIPHIPLIYLIALGNGTSGIVADQRVLQPWPMMYYIKHNILKLHSLFLSQIVTNVFFLIWLELNFTS